MIGQKNFLRQIQQQIDANTFPRFSILVGSRGSQFFELALHISRMLGENFVAVVDVKADTIREVIAEAYKVASKTLYFIDNAEMMSAQAGNALLKVTEEPPNNAYFMLSTENASNLLPTITSRGTKYSLDKYTRDELLEYYHRFADDENDIDVIKKIASTPGEIDSLIKMNASEFYAYAEKVVDNIATVSGSNAFKIAQKIQMKDSDEGYDLILFWKAVQQICFDRNLLDASLLTGQYLQIMSVKSINKQMLFDSWILRMREVLDNGSE